MLSKFLWDCKFSKIVTVLFIPTLSGSANEVLCFVRPTTGGAAPAAAPAAQLAKA